jgi:uncharacterized membrane protein
MFEIGDVLGKGWEGFKANAAILIAALMVAGCIMSVILIPLQIAGMAAQGNFEVVMVILLLQMIAQVALGAFFNLGFITIYLKVARGEKPDIKDLFSGKSRIVPAILVSLLCGLGSVIGFTLLIVPGIIFVLMVFFALYFVMDKNMGVMESIRASINATRGSKMQLFLFGLVAWLLCVAAMIPCGLGFIVVGPWLGVTGAVIYETLTKKEEAGESTPPAPVEG